MAAPKGMWECSKCGDYVDDYHKTCPRCGNEKEYLSGNTSYTYTSSTPSRTEKGDGFKGKATAKNTGESFAGFLLKGFAYLIWIGGLIASCMLANVSTGRYGETKFVFWMFLLYLLGFLYAGLMPYAIGRILDRVEGIYFQTEEYNIIIEKEQE